MSQGVDFSVGIGDMHGVFVPFCKIQEISEPISANKDGNEINGFIIHSLSGKNLLKYETLDDAKKDRETTVTAYNEWLERNYK